MLFAALKCAIMKKMFHTFPHEFKLKEIFQMFN